MKMLQFLLALACLTTLATGCGNSKKENTSSIAKDIPPAEVDMTTMPKMMVYSEINFMRSNPERYMGKIVRVEGVMDYSPHLRRHYCAISDATACCAVQLEYVLRGDHSHPFLNATGSQNLELPDTLEAPPQTDPENGAKIVIQGCFQTFRERDRDVVILADCIYCQ